MGGEARLSRKRMAVRMMLMLRLRGYERNVEVGGSMIRLVSGGRRGLVRIRG